MHHITCHINTCQEYTFLRIQYCKNGILQTWNCSNSPIYAEHCIQIQSNYLVWNVVRWQLLQHILGNLVDNALPCLLPPLLSLGWMAMIVSSTSFALLLWYLVCTYEGDISEWQVSEINEGEYEQWTPTVTEHQYIIMLEHVHRYAYIHGSILYVVSAAFHAM